MVLRDNKKPPLRVRQQGTCPLEKPDEIKLPAFRFPCHSCAEGDEYIGILWPRLSDVDVRSGKHRVMRDGSAVHRANRFVLYRTLRRIPISWRLPEAG